MLTYSVYGPLKLWRRITHVSWSLAHMSLTTFDLIWSHNVQKRQQLFLCCRFFYKKRQQRPLPGGPALCRCPGRAWRCNRNARPALPGNGAEIWWWLYSNPQYSVYSSLGLSKEYIREIDRHILYLHIIKSRYLWILWLLARCPLPSAVGSELRVQLGNPHSYLPRALLGLASQRNDDDSDKTQWPRFHLIFMDFYQLGTGYLSFAFIFCWNFSPNRSSLRDDALFVC